MTFLGKKSQAFTIVELIVVVAVIGVLVTVGVISYGAWQQSVARTQVRTALLAAAGGMEADRAFNDGYPTGVAGEYKNPDAVTVSGGSNDGGKTFCLDGVSTKDPTVTLYVDERNPKEPMIGTCATRTFTTPPTVPTNVVASTTTGSSVAVGWTGVGSASEYEIQCATDPGYIYDLKSTTVTVPTVTATIDGLSSATAFYCRVRAEGTAGLGAWSTSAVATTTNAMGSLPVATSIEGWWSQAPDGFLPEDGRAVSRLVYADLFAVISTIYGEGDGSTTFNLPDSRGRATVNWSSDVEFATIGQKTGSKTETLTLTQLPSHTHSTSGGCCAGPADSGRFRIDVNSPATRWSTGGAGGGQSHNNIQPSITKMSAIKYRTVDPAAPQLPAGTSISGYWNTAPSGYIPEQGQAVSRTTYNQLFAAIGTSGGAGNGSTTFNVPDSRGRVTVPLDSADSDFNTVAYRGGEKLHTLTIAEMPSHQHAIGGGFGAGPANGGVFRVDVNSPAASWSNTDPAGGGGSHNEVQPSMVRYGVIKTTNGTTGNAVPVGTTIAGYWSSATPPAGYLAEQGQIVSRTTYAELFKVIGTTYGAGDGSTTFQLPDPEGRVGVNRLPGDADFGSLNQKVGTKTVTLTVNQIPNHSHVGAVGFGAGPADSGRGRVDVNSYLQTWGPTGFTGGGGAHNNLQWYIVKRTFIKF